MEEISRSIGIYCTRCEMMREDFYYAKDLDTGEEKPKCMCGVWLKGK